MPANTGMAGARHRVAWFASKLAPTGQVRRKPVGAGLPANTGMGGARHRVARFAGKLAPTQAQWRHEQSIVAPGQHVSRTLASATLRSF
ncbi:hypothetical protein [Pseudomonas sp. RIT623]|uniref:hypothetical protein n=1 Tax=Pseudomonas sp. RIT623 TaxID=2559075 RepID=UPI002115C2A5|nr:hypothetical protein [Pseudomonas sp. RIT623]